MEIDVQRIVVGDERTRRGASCQRLQHGRFYFQKALFIQKPARRLHDAAPV
jgi:hypothetical protein